MSMATKKTGISASVIRRLPRYYRFIGELIKQGTVRISSGELAEKMSLTASQIRQDLNCFGGFGQQGYGYNLVELQSAIGEILGVKQRYKAVLIGAGNLGRAIANHMDFKEYGCDLVGIFDTDPQKKGKEAAGLKIMDETDMESFFAKEKPLIAILCIPKSEAQELADKLISLGIKAFWNFSHYDIKVAYKDAAVENVHLGDSIMMLSYALTHADDEKNE